MEFLAAAGLVFFEEKDKRVKFSLIIILITVFDALLMHNPFIVHGKQNHFAIKHCMLSLTISFSLLMVAGYRKY